MLEGGDAVLDVRRVGEDDGGHDGGEVVGQVVALVEAAVLGAVPPALLVARAACTELNGGARAGGEPAEHLDDQLYDLIVLGRRLRVGVVAWVVGDVPSWRSDTMPYGGVKDSGLGREGVRYAMEDMTEPRLLVVRTPPGS